jgi:hypothetical protein
MLASQADIVSGLHWYQRAYDLGVKLIHEYDGLTMGQAIGVIAALSPNNKWERNCIDAEAMIKTWSIGGDYNMIKVCTFNPNKAKAVAILFLNCYELDEWYQLMEDKAYDDIANNDDVKLDDDDEFIKQTFYPDEY